MKRWIGSAAVLLAVAISAPALPPGALGGAASDGAGEALAASKKPLTAEECAKAFGPSTPADAENVKQLVGRWANAPAEDRVAGEIALQRQVPSRAFPLLEAAAQRQDLSPDARAWLASVVEADLPRERARLPILERTNAWNEWNLRTATEGYEKFGHKDPKWDETARAAIREFVTPNANHKKAFELLSKAVDQQGCDDGFVLYLYARESESTVSPEEADQRLRKAAEVIVKSNYPASRKEFAALRAFEHYFSLIRAKSQPGQHLSPDVKAKLDGMMKTFMDLWPQMAAEPGVATPGVAEHSLLDIAGRIVNLSISPEMDRKRMYDWLEGPLNKALPNSALPLLFKGEFYTLYAWDARGGGWANTVTPDGWKHFADRLATAHQALDQAWAIDPTRSEICDWMITLAMGEGAPRDKMEVWFDRAMQLNPDDRQACSNKMTYLEPKWLGSPAAMIEFGHECLAHGSWVADIPKELQDAHQRLAGYVQDPSAYWRIPQVWADLQSIYVPLLKAEPTNDYNRSAYCYWACRTEHWDEGLKQFNLLGDRANPLVFGGKAAMEKLRAQAKEKGAP